MAGPVEQASVVWQTRPSHLFLDQANTVTQQHRQRTFLTLLLHHHPTTTAPMSSAAAGGGEASAPTMRRLMKEYQTEQRQQQQQQQQRIAGSTAVSAAARDENILLLAPRDVEGVRLLEWHATIRGPKGGWYEDGEFNISIRVPATYPTKPPSMRFTTRLWHPNVSWKTGEICLDVLSAQWSPAWTLSSALTAVIALLDAPEPDSPLNVDAATVFRTGDVRAYASMCRMYTLLWATPAAAG